MNWKPISDTCAIPRNEPLLFLWKDADWEEGKLVQTDKGLSVELIREDWQPNFFTLDHFSHYLVVEFPNLKIKPANR